jgi:hypothetical protein
MNNSRDSELKIVTREEKITIEVQRTVHSFFDFIDRCDNWNEER